MLISSRAKCCLAKKGLADIQVWYRLPPSFNVHLTFLNFSQLHLVRNHCLGGAASFRIQCWRFCSLPVSKYFWGFPHSRLIWESIFDRTHVIAAVINCNQLLDSPRGITSLSPVPLSPPALKLHVCLLLIYKFLTFYSAPFGSCVCIESSNHLLHTQSWLSGMSSVLPSLCI